MDKNSLAHTRWNCKYHKAIQEYIKNQEKEDMINEQISIKEYMDPFNKK